MQLRKQQIALSDLTPGFYTRVSKDEQAEATNVSLPDQAKATIGLAQRHGMHVYEDYLLMEDEKGSTLERPQLKKLRQWIKEGRINAVIVRSTDRLSRSPGDGEFLFEEFKRYGVRLFVVMHNREFNLSDMNDRDMLLQEMMFNRRWLQMLRQTMDWGKRGRVERGNPAMGGGVKYGFRKWKDDQKQWHYEFSDEAAYVQAIFNWFCSERVGVTEIQRRLRGKPTPKETRVDPNKLQNVKKRGTGEWSLSSIYSILRDPAYYGELTLYRESAEYDPVVIQIPMVIDRTTWDEAQRILDNGKQKSPRNSKHQFLLARLMTCPCGAAMHTDRVLKRDKSGYYHYYLCGRSHSGKNYTNPNCSAPRKTWYSHELDTALWSWLMEVSEKPELLRAYLEKSQQAIEVRNKPIKDRLSQLAATRKMWEQKLLNMLSLFGDRDLNDPRFKTERALLERARDEATHIFTDIDAEEEQLQKRIVHQSLSTKFINDWCYYVGRVSKGMAQFTFEEKRAAVESLGITASPVVEEDGRRFLLVFLYDQYAEKVPIDASDSLLYSSEYWSERGIIVFRIPLP